MLGFITRDWPRKLTAIFFALVIWFTVSQQIQEVRTYHEVVIELHPENDNVYISENQKAIIETITIRGTKSDIALLKDSKSVLVKVSIPETDTEIYTFTLSDDDFDFPSPTISIEQIVPEQFNINVDRLVTKKVRVEPLFSKTLIPDSKDTAFINTRPREVTIKGPAKVLKTIEYIETKQFEMLPESKSYKVELKEQDKIQIIGNSTVEVDVTIKDKFDTKTIHNIPIQILNSVKNELIVDSIQSTDKSVNVTLSGPKIQIAALSDDSIRAFIEIEKGDVEGEFTRKIKVYVNARDCKVQYTEPEEVVVKLVKKE